MFIYYKPSDTYDTYTVAYTYLKLTVDRFKCNRIYFSLLFGNIFIFAVL